MAAEQPTRDAFMAAIEAKISAWKAVLDSYRAAVSLDGPLGAEAAIQHPHPRHPHGETSKPIDLPVGVFRDKSLREAIEIYLGAGRRKQTNKEIAVGLQKGGIATTSVNFEATVATALSRMKEDGVILRFPDGWDLAASYPDSLRSRLEKDVKPKKRPRAKKATPRKTREERPSKPSDDKTVAMLEFIGGNPQGVSISDVVQWFKSNGVECSRDYVRVVTGRLSKRGRIDVRDGMYYPKVNA